MKEVRKCKICEKVFVARAENNVYCSKDCRKIGNRLRTVERQKEERQKERQFKEPGRTSNKSGIVSIAEIDAAARKAGMSYGQYVAMMGIR